MSRSAAAREHRKVANRLHGYAMARRAAYDAANPVYGPPLPDEMAHSRRMQMEQEGNATMLSLMQFGRS